MPILQWPHFAVIHPILQALSYLICFNISYQSLVEKGVGEMQQDQCLVDLFVFTVDQSEDVPIFIPPQADGFPEEKFITEGLV